MINKNYLYLFFYKNTLYYNQNIFLEGDKKMQDFRMETFLTVCEELNYTRAAHKLGLTQPAVSQHIHFLEES